MTQTKLTLAFLIVSILMINLASAAVVVNTASQTDLYPGANADISLNIKNTFDDYINDISFSIDYNSLKTQIFSPIGSSQYSIDEIRDDRSKSIVFSLTASSSIEPGFYTLPYTITYYNANDTQKTISGTIGVKVSSKVDLDFAAVADKPVIGEKTKLVFKVINKGFGEIKSVSIEIQPNGYTLLSSNKIYISSIASNDLDSNSFDVIFNKETPTITALVSYKDFENNNHVTNIDIPMKVYTREKALELGIIKKNNSGLYIIILIVVVIAWLVYRKIKKNKQLKLRESRNQQNQGK